jgi:hypothetical protein
MAEDRLASIVASQDHILDLAEYEAGAPQSAFKHGPRRPHYYNFCNKVELAIGGCPSVVKESAPLSRIRRISR